MQIKISGSAVYESASFILKLLFVADCYTVYLQTSYLYSVKSLADNRNRVFLICRTQVHESRINAETQ